MGAHSKTIIVFFDMVGVLEEFSHVDQLQFDISRMRPESTYAAEGVRALAELLQAWRGADHDVALVCISGIRNELTREALTGYLLARGIPPDLLHLHEAHNTPRLGDGDKAATKGDEVAAWLAANRCDAYIVFDDFNDGFNRPSFVHVDPDAGLSAETVETARAKVERQLERK